MASDFDDLKSEINAIVADYRAELKDAAGKAKVHADRIAQYLALIGQGQDRARNLRNIEYELSALASLSSVIASVGQTKAIQFQNRLIQWGFDLLTKALDAAL